MLGVFVLSKPFLALVWASLLASAAPNFVLGFDYSQWLFDRFRAMATDGSGAIFLLRAETTPGVNGVHCSVTKLSADGKSILWTDELPSEVSGMAVDPSGGVYVTPIRGDGAVTVAKLEATGSGIVWTSPILIPPPQLDFPLLAVDAKGRAYTTLGANLVRLSADGSAIEYSVTAAGTIYSIAADAAGAAFVTTDSLLTRFAPDGSVGYKATLATASGQHVVLDANGKAVVNTGGGLARFDANGGLISSSAFPAGTVGLLQTSFALDKAGDAYVAGTSQTAYYPVKNTLAPCGTQFLSVIAPDGTVLQTTYLPGADSFGSPSSLSLGSDADVLMVLEASQSFFPSRPGPLPAGQAPTTAMLLSFSPTATADLFPLACISNAGSHTFGPVTAGELLELSGSGLGPQQGVLPNATLQTPYPTRVSEVQVTFDGTPCANFVGPGWTDQRGRSVVSKHDSEYSGLCDVQRCDPQVRQLANGRVDARRIHELRHECFRRGPESGWKRKFRDEPGSFGFPRLCIRERPGQHHATTGGWGFGQPSAPQQCFSGNVASIGSRPQQS